MDQGKQKRAQEVLATTIDVAVSTQVMNEFFVVATRKLATPLSTDAAAAIVARMAALTCVEIDADRVRSAIRAGQRWQLSHWDALMVTAAQYAGCDRLLPLGLESPPPGRTWTARQSPEHLVTGARSLKFAAAFQPGGA